jgi:four helix bundle protein
VANQQTDKPTNQQTYSYRNLEVWKRAQELALSVVHEVKNLAADPVASTIVRQLVSAVGSISANIAEGHGRFSPAAYRNHLSIAKGSACETDSWLYLLREAGYLNPTSEDALHRKCSQVIAILTSKMRDLERIERERKGARASEDDTPYIVEEAAEERFAGL